MAWSTRRYRDEGGETGRLANACVVRTCVFVRGVVVMQEGGDGDAVKGGLGEMDTRLDGSV